MSYHKWDVDGPDDVNLRVTGWLLGHKHKGFWVQGVNLGAVLQESHVFPWPVFPGVERTSVSRSRCLLFLFHTALTKCFQMEMALLQGDFNKHDRFLSPSLLVNLPVSIGSNLFNSCLPACQEHLWIGHIEEVILHINRWRWILPSLKHLALLCQSNFLWKKTRKYKIRLRKNGKRKSSCNLYFKSAKCEFFHSKPLLWMSAFREHARHFFCEKLVPGQDLGTQREAEKSPPRLKKKASGKAENLLHPVSDLSKPRQESDCGLSSAHTTQKCVAVIRTL